MRELDYYEEKLPKTLQNILLREPRVNYILKNIDRYDIELEDGFCFGEDGDHTFVSLSTREIVNLIDKITTCECDCCIDV